MKTSFYLLILFTCSMVTAQQQEEYIEDNVAYASSIDEKNIYVQLTTVDQPTMMSMLHRGFYVYFDEKGKKKKNISIQYPINIIPPQRPNRNERGSTDRKELEEKEKKGPDIALLIEKMPKTATFINYDSEQEFHLDINSIGVSINYTYNEVTKELIYSLTIPKHNISDNANFSKLNIGIVTPKIESESKDENANFSFGGGGQGGGSGRGGGRGGQGGGRGGRGGGRGRGSQSGQEQGERPQEISLNI